MKLIIQIMLVMLLLIPLASAFLWRRRRRSCNSTPCTWAWRSCSRSCGGGTQSTYITRNQGSCGSCNRPSSRSCNNQCCPVNCRWASWGNWESCSQSCDGGTSTRRRSYLNTASCGGRACSGSSIETKPCNNVCCPQDCVWGRWESWGECSLTCGRGSKVRSRPITTQSLCGGASCHGDTTSSHSCNDVCCPVDCVLSAWSDWGSCNASCGTGSRSRSRVVTLADKCGGTPCNESLIEHEACNTDCCPVVCQLGEWQSWGSCSSTCGPSGTTMRHRSIDVPSVCGGSCSGDLKEIQSCNRICLHGGEVNQTSCSCPSGWEGSCCEADSDECTLDVCGTNANCQNTVGSFVCSCKVGFALKIVGATNETLMTNYDNEDLRKDNHSETKNVDSYEEASGESLTNQTFKTFQVEYPKSNSPTNFTSKDDLDHVERRSEVNFDESETNVYNLSKPSNISFPSNSETKSLSCVDLDECSISQNPCHMNATCLNVIGSYKCQCKPGFVGNGIDCKDLDECMTLPEICHKDATCENVIGSYRCLCNSGFTGNGRICTDIDECNTTLSSCHVNAICLNTIGLYVCRCKVGYSGDGMNCNDINECQLSICGPNMDCDNTVGSFECSCKDGFEIKSVQTESSSEAIINSKSSVNDSYEEPRGNSPSQEASGSFPSQEASGSFPSQEASRNFPGRESNGTCVDVDECLTSEHRCHENATCANVIGSHKCYCKPGFTGDGIRCFDVEECKEVKKYCHNNATCHNLIGSYDCRCKVGFTGDGKNCKDINECEVSEILCKESGKECENSEGSYSCICKGREEDGKCLNQTIPTSSGREPSRINLVSLILIVVGLILVMLTIILCCKKFKYKLPKRRQILISEETTSSQPESIVEKKM